jgi:hypothetical protein
VAPGRAEANATEDINAENAVCVADNAQAGVDLLDDLLKSLARQSLQQRGVHLSWLTGALVVVSGQVCATPEVLLFCRLAAALSSPMPSAVTTPATAVAGGPLQKETRPRVSVCGGGPRVCVCVGYGNRPVAPCCAPPGLGYGEACVFVSGTCRGVSFLAGGI